MINIKTNIMQNILNFFTLSKTERQIWLWSVLCLSLGFSPLLFNFVWGNHDWQPIVFGNSLTGGLVEGRFSQYAIQRFLFRGHIFPIISILLGFVAYTLALILLTFRFFKFEVNKSAGIIFTVTATSMPFIIEILYFHFITFNMLLWPLVMVFALMAAKKADESTHYTAYTLLSLFLLFLTLGGYPAASNFFAAAAACQLALTYNQQKNIKRLFIKFLPYAISLIIAFIMLKYCFAYFKANGYMKDMYNTEEPEFLEIVFKTPVIIKNALISLIQPQPYFPIIFKALTTIIVIMFFINYLTRAANLTEGLLRLAIFCFILLGLKFAAWMVHEDPENYFVQHDPASFMVRADFFSFPLFLLFCLCYLWQNAGNLRKNMLMLLSVCLIWVNLIENLSYAKTHVLAFIAEEKITDRVIDRIQLNPNFLMDVDYTVIQTGELSLRSKYHTQGLWEKYGYYTTEIPFTRHWLAHEFYNFYPPEPFVKKGNHVNPKNMPKALIHFITDQVETWPSMNSMYVDNIYAIIALSPKGKDTLIEQFNALPDEFK